MNTEQYDEEITSVRVVLCAKDPKLADRDVVAAFRSVGSLSR
jgi:hypothetical protein